MSTDSMAALSDLLNRNLRKSGAEIPEGSYPGILYGFSEPFKLKSSFTKEGQKETYQTVFNAKWAVKIKSGSVHSVNYLLTVPPNGYSHVRSKLYKMLFALGGKNSKLFKPGTGEFADGVNIGTFLGSQGIVHVKRNAKDFPVIETIGAAIVGPVYPNQEEVEQAKIEGAQLDDSDDTIPF